MLNNFVFRCHLQVFFHISYIFCDSWLLEM